MSANVCSTTVRGALSITSPITPTATMAARGSERRSQASPATAPTTRQEVP